VVFIAVSTLAYGQAPSIEGEALYREHCATCHERGVTRAAPRSTLMQLSAETVRFALTKGSMSSQAATLSDEQREAVIRFVANPAGTASTAAAPARCATNTKSYTASLSAPHWTGWGADESQRRFQPANQARLPAASVPRLKLKWAFGFPGVATASSQPAVVNGRLFVGSAARKVYALDAASGCTYWEFDTEFPVRTAITVGRTGATSAVFFGDQHSTAYAVDAQSGQLLWKTRIEDYASSLITGSPTLSREVLYVPVASNEDAYAANPAYPCCKFRGSVTALDAVTGKILWKSYTVPEEPSPRAKNKQGVQLWGPSGAGVWSSPTVDRKRGLLYVTTGNSHSDPTATTSDGFVAFDLRTGALVWSKQMSANDGYTLACDLPEPYNVNCPTTKGPDFDFASSAMLVDLGRGHRALIAGQKSGVVHAIDPDAQGNILWQASIGKGGRVGGVQWGSATDGKNIYVALSDAEIGPAPKGTPGAQAALGASFIFNAKVGGGLFALDPHTGATRWHTPHPGCGDKPGCSPGQSGAVTAIAGVVFSGGLDGHLRGYASEDGRIVWDVDTARDYQTVNGVAAHGGALNGPGPVVVNGMLYVNSGYTHLATAPGNVLLAFSVDGQ
jgi:polyvinyl alcohol dehydrogenase (cytochrome)